MNFSISNIGWTAENDERVYALMNQNGFIGLEIAPTRIFPENPYDDLNKAAKWGKALKYTQGLIISSMQSIWYGRSERIFGSDYERTSLIAYTKKAIDFAQAVRCKNLVFGCPRNRSIPNDADKNIAIRFFKEIGDYAYEHHTVVALEANPPIYDTNFINTTDAAIEFIEKVASKGFLLNLDIGTMIENKEKIEILNGKENLINHIHISEPGLKIIQKRALHKMLAEFLLKSNYNKFVSIEVGKQENVNVLADIMDYVKELFSYVK